MKSHRCPHQGCTKEFPRLYNLKRHLVLVHGAELTTPLASLTKAAPTRQNKRLSQAMESIKRDIAGNTNENLDADTTFGDTSTEGNTRHEELPTEYSPTLNQPLAMPSMPVVAPVYSMMASANATHSVSNHQRFLDVNLAKRQALKNRLTNLESVVQSMAQEAIASHGAQMQQLNSNSVMLFQALSKL